MKTKKKNNRSTEFASAYYVLSLLHRKQIDAHLTVGSYKAVDIVIIRKNGDIKTLDVKGASFADFRVNGKPKPRPNHYYAFVAYDRHFDDTAHLAEVFIVHSAKLDGLLHKYTSQCTVLLKDLRNSPYSFTHRWKELK